ncbi:MAG: 2-amino-4-hydroxy-6-hydroxymethyldihydropteridine diphosphokinase [Actinobacteria bacterium 13_1_20CM_4_69_9]|nr:MAG: 2-amino-4-hydroxy-6-hydroxymethyldihydropteridine diphosphokinase [Actinobacteria bacterium 13_1_20CM_4_69_9]
MIHAYVGLGSNLGDREGTLRAAVGRLRNVPETKVLRLSTLRNTEPVGYVDQPRFLNGAVELETGLSARGLLDVLLELEQAFGRNRAAVAPQGPRRKGVGGDLAREARLIRAMSHLDELDEFEAELELRLKKEYTAVFGLFRYCVLTQDATYLCNRLDLAQVSQPNYPFFHLRMEDVWVWDKNRPTRIIPRAEVWTSSDVTVEELRGEGEDSHLTAESLAEKIGESLSADDDL